MSVRVSVRLYNQLQLLLPREARGRAVLDLPAGSSVRDVVEHFGIQAGHPVAVNGVICRDPGRRLEEGDRVSVFSPTGGG